MMAANKAKRVRRKPTQERQAEIIDAAMVVLARQGARCFTAQGIADAVGLTAGAIYRHFGGTSEIADGVVAGLEEQLADRAWQIHDDPETRFVGYVSGRLELFERHPEISVLLFTDQLVHVGGSKTRARLEELRRAERSLASDCVKRFSRGRSKREATQVFLVLAGLAEAGRQAANHAQGGEKPTVSAKDLRATFTELLGIGNKRRRRQ